MIDWWGLTVHFCRDLHDSDLPVLQRPTVTQHTPSHALLVYIFFSCLSSDQKNKTKNKNDLAVSDLLRTHCPHFEDHSRLRHRWPYSQTCRRHVGFISSTHLHIEYLIWNMLWTVPPRGLRHQECRRRLIFVIFRRVIAKIIPPLLLICIWWLLGSGAADPAGNCQVGGFMQTSPIWRAGVAWWYPRWGVLLPSSLGAQHGTRSAAAIGAGFPPRRF